MPRIFVTHGIISNVLIAFMNKALNMLSFNSGQTVSDITHLIGLFPAIINFSNMESYMRVIEHNFL